jgi:hypothetical protein
MNEKFNEKSVRVKAKKTTSVSDPDPHWYGSPGSGSIFGMWIRIRTGNADPDPEARKFTRINKVTLFPAIQNGVSSYVSTVFS